jgi:hypothetical protein
MGNRPQGLIRNAEEEEEDDDKEEGAYCLHQ